MSHKNGYMYYIYVSGLNAATCMVWWYWSCSLLIGESMLCVYFYKPERSFECDRYKFDHSAISIEYSCSDCDF